MQDKMKNDGKLNVEKGNGGNRSEGSTRDSLRSKWNVRSLQLWRRLLKKGLRLNILRGYASLFKPEVFLIFWALTAVFCRCVYALKVSASRY